MVTSSLGRTELAENWHRPGGFAIYIADGLHAFPCSDITSKEEMELM